MTEDTFNRDDRPLAEGRSDKAAGSASRQIVRQWLEASDDAIVTAVHALGAGAIRDAERATQRLQRSSGTSFGDSGVLARLEAFAAGYAGNGDQGKRGWFPFGRKAPAVQPDLDALASDLAHEHDSVARTLIFIETDRVKLEEVERGLDDAVHAVRSLGKAVEAAARELSVARPARAALFRDTAAPGLLSREQDLLTQRAIIHQAILALQIVADGQRALAQSLDRARGITVAALRTAMLARQAVGGNREMMRQAQALEQTAEAARTASGSRREVERALADAVAQARRAIDIAHVPLRAP